MYCKTYFIMYSGSNGEPVEFFYLIGDIFCLKYLERLNMKNQSGISSIEQVAFIAQFTQEI